MLSFDEDEDEDEDKEKDGLIDGRFVRGLRLCCCEFEEGCGAGAEVGAG